MPDGDVVSRDCQPSEHKHIAPGLGDPGGLVPIDLVDHGGRLPRHIMAAEGCRSYPMRCRGVRFAREDFALAEPKSPTVESSLTTERNADAETPQVMLMRRIGVACEGGTSSAMSGRRSAGCLLTGNCSTVTR